MSGHIAQSLGDGLRIYFGYPHAHEDDAQKGYTSQLRDGGGSTPRPAAPGLWGAGAPGHSYRPRRGR